jgi:3-deoxy-manno-octulosonate cytidylyltransferase (CMP-KDO synthetase)
MNLGLIPARLKSTRLFNKPLLLLDGLPVIVHTMRRAMLCRDLDKVIVCTDSDKIFSIVKRYGGEAIKTKSSHSNGTERIAEVAKKIKKNYKLIIDIQCDEVFLKPKSITKLIKFHKKNKNFDIVVPCIEVKNNISSKNLVKVIFSKKGEVVYFSRSVAPFDYHDKKIKYYKVLSVVSFKPQALRKYNKFRMGRIEKIEGIELLRAIENNIKIGTFIIKTDSFSVDVNEDLQKAIDLMPKDRFRKFY